MKDISSLITDQHIKQLKTFSFHLACSRKRRVKPIPAMPRVISVRVVGSGTDKEVSSRELIFPTIEYPRASPVSPCSVIVELLKSSKSILVGSASDEKTVPLLSKKRKKIARQGLAPSSIKGILAYGIKKTNASRSPIGRFNR